MTNRRESTKVRYNLIHEAYDKIMKELGDMGKFVSKSYIYNRIREETHLSIKTVSYILNHTCKDSRM